MLVVKETLKIGRRLPKMKAGRGRGVCDTKSPWTHKQEASWMLAGFLWSWNRSSSVYNIAKCIEFHNCCTVCCEVTGGPFTSQITSQCTLWSSMISVSWVTKLFPSDFGLPRVWVVSCVWYSSTLKCFFAFKFLYFTIGIPLCKRVTRCKIVFKTGYLGSSLAHTIADSQGDTLKSQGYTILFYILREIFIYLYGI